MQRSKKAPLFDQLVGSHKKSLGHRKAERFRGLEVDDQLELDWSLDRKLAWFLALEDAIGIGRGAPKVIGRGLSRS